MWPFPVFPEKATRLAGEIDALYFFAVAVTIFFSLLIAALVFYFATRYRRRHDEEVGRPEKAGTALEITWSVIPLVILLFMFFWGAKIYFQAFRAPAGAAEYYVVAKQWMWKMQHPEGQREINHLHFPVNQPIKLIMTSEDVIHSFFVPAFRVKADVLPGRYTSIWFEADKTGTFTLFCTEYCGAEHSQMIGSVTIMEQRDYEEWLAGRGPAKPMAVSGEELFSAKACDTCHRPDSAERAPILAGIYGEQLELADGQVVTVDDEYLRESILNSTAKVVKGYQPLMPVYQGQISEEELLQLISYIKSLEGDGEGHGEAAGASSAGPAETGEVDAS